jgi:lysophospholipase L1-like esterase
MNKVKIFKIGFLVSSLLASLLLLEGLLFMFFEKHEYYIWPPNFRQEFSPEPDIIPGIEDLSTITANEFGIRGQNFSKSYKYHILTVGGSTTECLYLDDTETWPLLLQNELNQRHKGNSIWIGNVGRSGNGSKEHILQIKHMLRQFPQIDLVLVLLGVNDFSAFVARKEFVITKVEENYYFESPSYTRGFTIRPYTFGNDLPFYKKTITWHHLRNVKAKLNNFLNLEGYIQDISGKWIEDLRLKRSESHNMIQNLPNLDLGLLEYSQNIQEMIRIARSHNKGIAFITQPVLWRSDLPEELSRLCWFGWTNRGPKVRSEKPSEKFHPIVPPGYDNYFDFNQLSLGMDTYNRNLQVLCQKEQVPCFDLASVLSKDSDTFYDDCHFNEPGARKVAQALLMFLDQIMQNPADD